MASSYGKAAVLIDNGYLAKVLKNQFDETRFDYLKFSNEATQGFWRLRTYVYDCMPYRSDPPTEFEQTMYAKKQKFFDTLKKLPSVEPRFGRLRPRKEGGFVQKGVDIFLATDLVKLALKGQVQKAILLTGDADYVPAVQVAKDEGVSITLYHAEGDVRKLGETSSGYSNALWDICDERRVIDKALIERCKYEPMAGSMKFYDPTHK
jgi:uncharacterized LabA/DUF88 family protein